MSSSVRASGRSTDGRLHVEDLVDPGKRRLTSLEQVDGPPQREHRPGEHADVGVERHKPSDSELSSRDEQTACPEEDQRGNGTKEVDQRKSESPDRHKSDIAPLDVDGALPQSASRSLLTREDLDDADAGHGFLYIVAESGERVLHVLEQPEDDGARACHDKRDEHKRHQRHQRQRAVEAEHGEESERRHDDEVGDHEQAVAQCLAHRLEVICHERHQISSLVPVVELS